MGSKIIVALKRKYHCEHAEAVLRREGYDYPIFELQPDDTTFRQLQRCVKEGAQVLITGDVHAEKIIEKVNIAVTTIHRSKLSFEEAIQKALSYSSRVAIIWREKDIGALHKACEGIEDQVIKFTSPSDENYDSIFQQIVREKIPVAIGPYPINQYAEKYNVRAINLPYADEDILSAVHIAEHNLQAIEKNLEYIETLNIIQNNISEGIITLYPNGNIQMMNKSAAEILNVNPQAWEGLSIISTEVKCTEL